MALAAKPEVAFLDEPTSGVDVLGRDTIRALVRQLTADGCAVVLATHELDEAERMADRMVALAELPEARGAALYQPWFSASIVDFELGRFALSHRVNNIGRARSTREGHFWAVAGYDTLDAACHFQEGNWDDVEASASAALAAEIVDAYEKASGAGELGGNRAQRRRGSGR